MACRVHEIIAFEVFKAICDLFRAVKKLSADCRESNFVQANIVSYNQVTVLDYQNFQVNYVPM